MKKIVTLPEGKFKATFMQLDANDKPTLLQIYNHWRALNQQLYNLNSRLINIPEGLSESSFCLAMNCLRLIVNIQGANSSWDCYDINNSSRLQIKACSVIPDLTSFGPYSVWDQLYFLDFFKGGSWNGSFDIFLIPNNLIYDFQVNLNQTFIEQQAQGRRPRLSIWKNIIVPNNLKPISTYKL